MNTVPSYVGNNARIVIGAFNIGNNPLGVYTPVKTPKPTSTTCGSPARLAICRPRPFRLSASITINRQSGEILLSNTGSSNLNIHGYSLTSTNGSFGSSAGLSIANNYDDTPATARSIATMSGRFCRDPIRHQLSESEISVGGNGGTLSTSTPIDLGDAWLRTPYQDVAGTLLLADGSQIGHSPSATADSVIPSGDLNGDGDVTGADWTLFKAGQGTNFTGMSKAEAYLKGDLTGNLSHDLNDFFAFRTQYELFNGGSGSFARMLAGVPEPGAGLLLVLGGVLTSMSFRQRNRRGVFSMNKMFMIAVVAAGACSLLAQPAAAQTGVAHWSFDSSTLTIDGGNITAVAEKTNNHNATPGTRRHGRLPARQMSFRTYSLQRLPPSPVNSAMACGSPETISCSSPI